MLEVYKAIELNEFMVIVKRGYQWILYTKDRKKILGKFRTKNAALKRERQIIFFKNMKR